MIGLKEIGQEADLVSGMRRHPTCYLVIQADEIGLAVNPAPLTAKISTTANQIHMKTIQNRKSGFTLVEIMIVVAIIGLLAAIAIPNFVKARTTAQTNACIANLKQVQGAVEQWALEQKKAPTSTVALTDISGSATAFIKQAVNTELKCPAGGTYAVSTVSVNPTCDVSGHSL